ncbi:hypothetical protein MTR62_16485 [Novosphingobium sp. 1949]|uniref:Uncharacterized protein n=1 Tax=Novosphingobium organovorum TaxID=2930092 RepID=A0ABT0BH74_9SPHN|nr:hypothetical protein [Novosphingobium organovorum]MCJ2184275.1 hypothetical protein [Novosphingobium organovorum]
MILTLVLAAAAASAAPAATGHEPAARAPTLEIDQTPRPMAVPGVPGPYEYLAMSAQERYALRLRVRVLPDDIRKPWLRQLQINVDSLPGRVALRLHDERNAMDVENGTLPVKAP